MTYIIHNSFAQTGKFDFSGLFNTLKNNCLNFDIKDVNTGENFCWTLNRTTGKFHRHENYSKALGIGHTNFHNYNDKIPALYDKKSSSSIYKMKLDDRGHKHIVPLGHFIFFENGKRHSLFHPSVIKEDGGWAWWLYGKNKTQDIEQWAINNDIDLTNMNDVDKSLFRITWLTGS